MTTRVRTVVRHGWLPAACAAFALVSLAPAQSVVVKTKAGGVRGTVRDGVASFKGIPFAAPPVGKLRWRAPQPLVPWQGVRDATRFGPHCPQVPLPGRPAETPFDEDCLYVNVWTPAKRGNEPLPVMVWVHGGGFVRGGTAQAHFDGAAFAHESVVLVSANYRIGRFGFFAHPALSAVSADEGRLGNYGLMDQIAALQWVRKNIAAFGGDPKNVTLFGESAGGVSVHHLMTSPLAKGLFARAISQSGLGRFDQRQLPFWTLAEAERLGVAFAKPHGIEGAGAQALDALRSLSASAVLGGLSIPALFLPSNTFGGPIADGVLVPKHSEHFYAAGEAAPVPLIVGATSADGFFRGGTLEKIYAPFGDLSVKAENIYDPTGDADARRIGTLVAADLLFLEPARHIARLHSAAGHPVYLYRFSYVAESLRETSVGAPHFSDVPFVFGTLDAWVEEPTANDRRVAGEIRAYWLAFARSGVPAPGGLPAWPAFTGNSAKILDFRPAGPRVGPDPARQRLDLAEELSGLRRKK